ncbi:MAG TPA: hypothetical protein VHO06_11280, partial [Polyangia bacterium]|nr:hypothetical protein [Polyangia bacterium]
VAGALARDRGSREGGPWPAPATAALEPLPRLEVGNLSLQVGPPPPPVSRNPAARPARRPEAGPEVSSRRLGTIARLGFGMRHW